MSPATWALSSWVGKYADDLVPLAAQAGFEAVEWDLNFIPLPLSEDRRRHIWNTFLTAGIGLRFHLPYSMCDLGNLDRRVRQISLQYLELTLELLTTLHADYCVIHFCDSGQKEMPPLDELHHLMEVAGELGITIGIENLMRGPSSDPNLLKQIISECGADVALDTGHAIDADGLSNFLNVLGPMVTHVHFYGSEDNNRNHLPFHEPAERLKIAALLEGGCPASWWTCEMDSITDCSATRNPDENT